MLNKINIRKHFLLVKILYYCLFLLCFFIFSGCTMISNGKYYSVTDATDLILKSDKDIGLLNVYVRNNDALKSLCDVIRLKNKSNFRVNLQLANSDFSRTGDNFKDCKCITSVILPESVVSVDDYAFMGCDNLQSVVIPASVKKLGNYSFYGCTSLSKISFSGNNCTEIGYSAFSKCAAIEKFTICSSVKKLGINCFIDCRNIKFSVDGNNEWTKNNSVSSSISLTDYNSYIGEEELTRN